MRKHTLSINNLYYNNKRQRHNNSLFHTQDRISNTEETQITYTSQPQMNNPSTHTFTNSLWDSTSSSTGGGAIYVSGTSSLTLSDCLFISCKSSSQSSSDTFGGGALYFTSSGTLSVSSALFLSCSAVGERGGAIHIHASGDVSLIAVTVADCHCSVWGGGILVEAGPSFSVSDSILILCSTRIGGACGFYGRKSEFSVFNCLFSQNSATDSSPGGGAIQDHMFEPTYKCKYYFSFFTQNSAQI